MKREKIRIGRLWVLTKGSIVLHQFFFYLVIPSERLTEVIEKVRKEIIIKGSSPVAAPKPSLSGQVESLIKATFGRFGIILECFCTGSCCTYSRLPPK